MSAYQLAAMLGAFALQAVAPPVLDTSRMPGNAMANRVSAAASANMTVAACTDAVERASTLNAEALFVGSVVCSRVSREDDSSFLILAGQARGSADMNEASRGLAPGDPNVPFGAIDLWGFIYMYAGGFGPDEILRDQPRADGIFARLRTWRPMRPAGYSPGWSTPNHLSDTEYQSVITEAINQRIAQLSRTATLYRNNEYWTLQQELSALLRANNNSFVVGTPAQTRLQAIQARQQQIAENLGVADPVQ